LPQAFGTIAARFYICHGLRIRPSPSAAKPVFKFSRLEGRTALKDDNRWKKGKTMPSSRFLCFTLVFATLLFTFYQVNRADAGALSPKVTEIEARIQGCKTNPAYKDDVYGLIVVKDALESVKEGSGGIGACLVDERSGDVIARGRNRQYIPYFRSDLHAEMDLLTRYEDWLRKRGGSGSGEDPRNCQNLVLISSVEPCPMCLTRILNAGIKKMYYVVPDEKGGMVSRIDQLPPFWKQIAEKCDYRQAQCSPEIQKLARDLFKFSMRTWAGKTEQPSK
jgi:cytosine deaminase